MKKLLTKNVVSIIIMWIIIKGVKLLMYFDGIIIGFIAFVMIGLFHPLVIYGEYHFGIRIWTLFLCFGIIFCVASIMIKNTLMAATMGIIGFSSFWSIFEVFKQRKRVDKGWFPKKDKHSIRG
jgi:hypothetical protein